MQIAVQSEIRFDGTQLRNQLMRILDIPLKAEQADQLSAWGAVVLGA